MAAVRSLTALALVAHLILSLAPGARANPRGGTVVHGGASISESSSTLTVDQVTDRAIINWQSFGNASGEAVRFNQPGATSVTLNRVVGIDPSSIAGSLSANGRLFLINPNGIVFGGTARVNVGSLVASTLAISDQDFLDGNYKLLQGSGQSLSAVVNAGQITVSEGGVVALVAPIVSNSGQIVAAAGRVFLAATNGASIPLDAGGYVSLSFGSGRGSVRMPTIGLSTLLEHVVNTTSFSTAQRVTRLADGTVFLRDAQGILLNEGSVRVDGPTAERNGAVVLDATRVIAVGPGSQITAGGSAGGSGRIDVRSSRGVVDLAYTRAPGQPGTPALLRADRLDLEIGGSFVSDAQRSLRLEASSAKLNSLQGSIGRISAPVHFDVRTLDAFGSGENGIHLIGTTTIQRVIVNDLTTTPGHLTITGTGTLLNAELGQGIIARSMDINFDGTIGTATSTILLAASTGQLLDGGVYVVSLEPALRLPSPIRRIGLIRPGDPGANSSVFVSPGVIGITEAPRPAGPSGEDESIPPLRVGPSDPSRPDAALPAPAQKADQVVIVGSRDNVLQATLRSDRVKGRSDASQSKEVRSEDPLIQVVSDEEGQGEDLDGGDGETRSNRRRSR